MMGVCSMPSVLINTEQVVLPSSSTSLLQFLREVQGLTAAKPACNGGDCGACLVLLAELDQGVLRFRAVNSCLLILSQVEGCVVITPEALVAGKELTPVQQALVEQGAIQCGYCTPGLSIALTAALLNGDVLTDAVAGNLCRCTGYGGIRRACAVLDAQFPRQPRSFDEAVTQGLLSAAVVRAMQSAVEQWTSERSAGDTLDLAGACGFIAGGTDWSVQHAHREPDLPVPRQLQRQSALQGISVGDTHIDIGAAVTLAELQSCDELTSRWPDIHRMLEYFAAPGIRNSATAGGNLANASPIADLAVLLLALEAELVLAGLQGRYRLPLSDFYLGYRQTALAPGERVERILIPREPERRLCFEKICRRPHDDIASVNSALTEDTSQKSGCFGRLSFAAGGVGPVPLLLTRTAATLESQPVTVASVRAALALIADEIAPIDDLRGTARYKAALLRHQLIAHLVRLHPSLSLPELLVCRETAV